MESMLVGVQVLKRIKQNVVVPASILLGGELKDACNS